MGTRLLKDYRLQLLIFSIIGQLLILGATRALIFVTMPERFSAVPTFTAFQSFAVGLRYDVVVALLLSLPLGCAVVLVPAKRLSEPGPRLLLHALAIAAFAICIVLSVVDYFYFEEFFTHLDHKVFQYVGYNYVWASVWQQFPVIPAIIAVLISILAYRAALRARQWEVNSRIPSVVLFPVLAPFFILGIRSSVGPKPINSAVAYELPSIAAAQLSLNGLFTLREAFDGYYLRNEPLAELLPLLPEKVAYARAQSLILPRNERLNGGSNPLERRSVSAQEPRDLNVVVVILESFSWHYVGAMGGDARVSPNLDALIKESAFFDRCFAVGDRTVHGVSGVVAGFPDLPGESISTRYPSHGNIKTIGSVLAERNYETIFIYGGSPLYDHRGAFLGSNGYSRMHLEDRFQSRTFRSHLGYSDEDLYREAERIFGEERQRPFHALLLTLSFHRPYEIPPGRVAKIEGTKKESLQLTAVAYADWALGEFMKRMKQSAYYDDTLFVFVADHTGGARGNTFNPDGYRVPLLLHAPKYLTPTRNHSICSQTDIAPTILDMVGGVSVHSFFGSSLFGHSTRQALMLFGTRTLGYLSPQGRMVVIPLRAEGESSHVFTITPEGRFNPEQSVSTELQLDAISLLQTADRVYRSQTE